jgi:hypothetical protein
MNHMLAPGVHYSGIATSSSKIDHMMIVQRKPAMMAGSRMIGKCPLSRFELKHG